VVVRGQRRIHRTRSVGGGLIAEQRVQDEQAVARGARYHHQSDLKDQAIK
jgi:hypothetical protein